MLKLPKGFTLKKKGRISYISYGAAEGFELGFTLRTGGYSGKPYDTLNFGRHTDDDKKTVMRNIKLFEKESGAVRMAAARQVHGDRIIIVRSPGSGVRGQKRKSLEKTEADAVVTDMPGIAASVRVADCAGTVIIDPVNKVAASVHSGWRGVANKIPAKTVRLLKKKFGSDPKKLVAAVSPAIGPCCYDVGPDVYKLQKQNVFSNIFEKRCGKVYMNLWKGVKNLLVSSGLDKKNIHICDMCTSCNPKLFFSHRRDEGKTGRMLVFGVLK